jgi:hypothetical protein
LVACGISTAILFIIGSKFFGSKVIVPEDSATKATFLYNKLDQLVIQSLGSAKVPIEVGQWNTQVPKSIRRSAPVRI